MQIVSEKFYEYSRSIRGYSKCTIRRYRNSIEVYCKFSNVQFIEQVAEENLRALFFHGRTSRNWSVNTFIAGQGKLTLSIPRCLMKAI